VWAALNKRGISQKRIAATCGVVEHTVYTELRKRREAAG
jgi:transposase